MNWFDWVVLIFMNVTVIRTIGQQVEACYKSPTPMICLIGNDKIIMQTMTLLVMTTFMIFWTWRWGWLIIIINEQGASEGEDPVQQGEGNQGDRNHHRGGNQRDQDQHVGDDYHYYDYDHHLMIGGRWWFIEHKWLQNFLLRQMRFLSYQMLL